MALSDYERRVLTDIEQDLRRTSRSLHVRVAAHGVLRWVRAWWLPVCAALLTCLLCALAGELLVPQAALVITGVLCVALGGVWGRYLRRGRGGC
jgi:4-hydroxybenzoate polyprenyltransferase